MALVSATYRLPCGWKARVVVDPPMRRVEFATRPPHVDAPEQPEYEVDVTLGNQVTVISVRAPAPAHPSQQLVRSFEHTELRVFECSCTSEGECAIVLQ